MRMVDKLLGKEVNMTMKKMSIMAILILVIIAPLSMIGCDGETQTSTASDAPARPEMNTFSKYGFSFEYPKDFLVWRDGLLEDNANENSGIVQVAPEEEGFPLFAVSWVKAWQWGLEGGLEAGFAGIENWEGIESVQKGEFVETTKSGLRMLYEEGHRMLYQFYAATTKTQGEIVYGIVGAFYCDNTQRAFGLVTMQKTTIGVSTQEALDNFKDYLDYFACH